MVRAGIAAALLALLGCSRSFPEPPSSGAPALVSVAPTSAFEGKHLILQGANFASDPTANQVLVGQTLAFVVSSTGQPSSGQLEVVMPALGGSAMAAKLTVTVAGQTTSALPVQYLGSGTPQAFTVASGGDLSPVPVDVAAVGDLRLVPLLGNPGLVTIFESFSYQTMTPLAPGLLPLEVRLVPEPLTSESILLDGDLWVAALDTQHYGTIAVLSSDNANTGDGEVLGQVPGGLQGTDPNSPWFFSPMRAMSPGIGGALIYSDDGGSELGPGVPDGFVATVPISAPYFQTSDALTAMSSDGGNPTSLPAGTTLSVAALEDAGTGTYVLQRHLMIPRAGGGFDLADAGPDIDLVVFDPTGDPSDPPISPAPYSISISPSGTGVWLETYADGLGVALNTSLLEHVDLVAGTASSVALPTLAPVGGVVASSNRLALWSQQTSTVSLLDFTGAPTAEVLLPGLPFRLRRDQLPPYHFLAVVSSAPELVEFDDDGHLVRSDDLSNGVTLSSADPSGQRLAFWATRYPALTVLSGQDLGAPEFQSPGPANQNIYRRMTNSSWRPLADGGEELCAYLDDPIDESDGQIRCGPPDAFFDPNQGCSLLPGPLGDDEADDFQSTLVGGTPVKLAALPDGSLRVYGNKHFYSCAAGCPTRCTTLGAYPNNGGVIALTPTGAALVGNGSEVDLLGLDGSTTKICDASNPGCPVATHALETLGSFAVDPSAQLAAVLGNNEPIYDLQAKQLVAEIDSFADTPTAQAFSADGTRLYLGTELGKLEEFSVEPPLSLAAPLQPVRTLQLGDGIKQIVPSADGSRLVLTHLHSDRVDVVQ